MRVLALTAASGGAPRPRCGDGLGDSDQQAPRGDPTRNSPWAGRSASRFPPAPTPSWGAEGNSWLQPDTNRHCQESAKILF